MLESSLMVRQNCSLDVQQKKPAKCGDVIRKGLGSQNKKEDIFCLLCNSLVHPHLCSSGL